MPLLLLSSWGAAAPLVPATVDGSVFGDPPHVDYSGFADADDPGLTLNNYTPITFHNGSNMTYHNAENITFHDPYGNPSKSLKASIPRMEFAGTGDL